MEPESVAEGTVPPPRPKWPWITLIVLQVFQIITLLPWLMFAGLAVMAFDAPDSTKHWQPWAFVLTIWSYPVWLLLVGAGSWVLFALRNYKTAVILSGILCLPLPLFVLVIVLASVWS